MELPEPIEEINKHLKDDYGCLDSIKPNWRIVWSEDQFETRLMDVTKDGFSLINPEYREVPKYRQWIQNKYVLERLVEVPYINENELTNKISYEPVWVFENGNGDYQPPLFRAAKFVIETVHKQAAKVVGVKYKDPESNPKEAFEVREQRLQGLEKELFGNETTIGDSLMKDSAVGFGIRKRNDSI
jgi:hypothetical protein